ncbi:MAG TPA: glycosyltransferase family 2 protein [Pirellulaceae bacterium]|nr:glycosyltransferase family 2 protein [Pirellulaceae bacterium]HMO92703.1 glycosyltransferase family 2 protein [Pirellulaceae bacterium]HMP70376.1 glycosyltransferase family 2 protein [Pirellulaceae bacterium]
MTTILWVLTIYLFVLAIFQTSVVLRFCRWLLDDSQDASRSALPAVTPDAAIVISLRGFDPSLDACLRGLCHQEYLGNYQIFAIVDHIDDPAWRALHKLEPELLAKICIIQADSPTGQCSLKCDRLAQTLDQLPKDFELICLIDADTIPDRRWLESLVEPFRDAEVGAASGHRWFYPGLSDRPQAARQRCSWGSWLRYLWNSAAVPQMHLYGIVWGGSMALRRQAVVETRLHDVWRKALFDDVLIKHIFEANEWRVVQVRELLIPNFEQVSLRSAIEWITRQLLDTRLYHRCWPWIFSHAVGSTLLWMGILGAAVYAAGNQVWHNFIWGLALLLGLALLNFGLLSILEHVANLRINRRRTELGAAPLRWLNFAQYLKILVGVGIVQCAFVYSAVRAACLRTVSWRGCEYRIRGPYQIEVNHYQVFRSNCEAERESVD